MDPSPRILIARDRRWAGTPVDLAALGRALERSAAARVVKSGPERLVVEAADGPAAARVFGTLPEGVVAEPVQVFDPMANRTHDVSGPAKPPEAPSMAIPPNAPPPSSERPPSPRHSRAEDGRAEDSRTGAEASGPTLTADAQTHAVGVTRYVIGPRRGLRARASGRPPLSIAEMDEALAVLHPHEHVRTVHPRASRSPISQKHGEARHHVLAHLSAERIAHLRRSLPPEVIVEPQIRFERRPVAPTPSMLPPTAEATTSTASTTYRFAVTGEGDRALAGVPLTLFCAAGASVNVKTGPDGTATATVPQDADTPLHGFYAKPVDSYWDLYVTSPFLDAEKVNHVRLRSLAETQAGFPTGFRNGWGQRAMQVDRLPEEADGRGVRVGIIDSGADNRHPSLAHIRSGADCTGSDDPDGWTTDTIGHGTHVAGVIAARPNDGQVFRGFAPNAEVHAFKVFPSGASDVLLDALDHCLHLDVDVVNMSLGSDQTSELIEQKLEELYAAGIACFVAAGNSGQRVQFPARSPFVLAVGAVGQVGTLAAGSWDETQLQPGLVTPDGVFSPRFSCFGPEVGVCAPGVGIVSTLPGGTFGPDTGTSMAAPHVTGLAALLLAHHPALGPQVLPKGPGRVAALFALVKRMAAPTPFGAERAGAGLPTFAPLVGERQGQPQRGIL